MITVSAHLERILEITTLLETETVDLAGADGRCLVEPVLARIPVPPWTNSAMDGYAVRHKDIETASEGEPVQLKVVADVPAGSSADPQLGQGEAVRIMTGAPIPESADTVVPQELTDGGTELVKITATLDQGRHIRHAGEDRSINDLIAPPGRELSPESLAAIASAGVGEVTLTRRPTIAVISTGDELVNPGTPISRGQIPDSNALLVSLLAARCGATISTHHAGDGPGELAEVIEPLTADLDVLILTGGVSVGAFDPVKDLFANDDSIQFDRVAMQPGKPQAFGRLSSDGPLLFGLPGNPVSSWVSFMMFVRPALRKMQGFETLVPTPVQARAAEHWLTPTGRMQVIPVRIQEGAERQVLPAASGGSGSHLIASLANADGYALVDAETESVQVDDLVQTVRLRDPEQFNLQTRSRS